MSADLTSPHNQPAPRERVLFLAYQVAAYVTFNVIDDAAMLAFFVLLVAAGDNQIYASLGYYCPND